MFNVSSIYDFVPDYVDLAYIQWVFWLFMPLMISFLAPLVLVLMLYFNELVLRLFSLRNTIKRWQSDWRKLALGFLAICWETHSRIWNGYEVADLKNVPNEGPALLIYYHGALPIDIYYLVAKILLYKERSVTLVTDQFVFDYWPGVKHLYDAFNLVVGTKEDCLKALNQGKLVAISPGGTREALFSDHSYQLLWKCRVGFAKLAIEANVPIIPIFTKNVRECFRTLHCDFMRRVYERTRLPVVPIYGGFPVKLITFIGTPISPDGFSADPEKVARVVADHLNRLITTHQRIPGSVFMSLLERIPHFYKLFNKTVAYQTH